MYSIKRSLQLKVLVILLLMGAALLSGSYLALQLFVLPAFQQLELEQSQSHLTGVERAIDGELQSLRALDLEYAWWDGSYAFIRDPGSHQDFITNNGLDSRYWSQIDIDMMLFFDLDGKLVWGSIIDPNDGHPLSLAKNLQPWAGPDHPLVVPRNGQGGTMGFLRLPAGLMLVTAFPILRNDQSGPPAGSVVVGRFVTPELTSGFAPVNLNKVTFYPLSGPALPATARRAADTLLSTPGSVLTAQTASDTYVHELIRDVTENPVAVLEIVTPRQVSLLGIRTGTKAVGFLAAATLLFILTGWLLFRRWMLSPVLALQQQISGMHEQRKLAQVHIDSEDEIGALAQHFNHLVKELGQAWRDLEKSRDEALQSAKVKGEFLAAMSHEIRTPLNGVLGMAELLQATELGPRQREFVRGIRNSGE
ncbi:MAG: CHASE4 domain-containing protein, partial [Lysobacterales bacterium]